LCIDNTVFNFDIIIDGEKVYIIEAAARCGATGIPECMGIMYGTDFFQCIIDNALEKNIHFGAINDIYAASFLFSSKKAGILKSIDYPNIGSISFDYLLGYNVPKFVNATHRIGQAIISANTRAELDDKLLQLKNSKIIVEEVK